MALPFAPNSQMIGPAMGAATPQADTKTAPYTPNANLPSNYQDARNAFQQQQEAQRANDPFGPGQMKLTVVGNDQFGQQFGYAGDADAFNQFYNQNYANAPPAFDATAGMNTPKINPGGPYGTAPDGSQFTRLPAPALGIVGGPVGSAPVYYDNQGMRQNQREYDLANPNTRNDLDYVTGYADPSDPLRFKTQTGGLQSLVPSQPTINNPLSMTIPGSVPNFAAVPDLGMTAGSAPGGGGLTQGTALPNITTVQKQATATPTFYTDYLNQLAKQGASAAQNAQFIGPTGLQSKAFDLTAQNVGSYDPALDAATNLAGQAGSYDAAAAAGRYMNPYTQNVVDALGVEGRRNIEKYLAPGATAAAVGSGQFGSKRGAEVLGQAINTGLSNLNLAQSQALQTGYSQALQASQQEQQARLAGSQRFSDIANQRQALGLGDINAAATIGEQQRALAQNQQLFPMQQLTSQAALLRGQTIPTSTASSYTGPIPGAYNASPLSQIAGLGALAKEVPNLFTSIDKGIDSLSKGAIGSAVNKGFNALTGGPSGKPIAYQQPLADGGVLNVATDGTRSIMYEDGRVLNFDKNNNPLPSGSVDPGYVAPGGITEQDLYDQEAAYNDYANYYDNYYDYYNNDNYFPNYEPPPPDYYYPNYEE